MDRNDSGVRDPTGTALLTVDEHARAHRIDMDPGGGRVTDIPFPRGTPNALAW